MAEITAASVKELRERTGAGMMDCKKALAETNGEMEAAVDWLRAKGLPPPPRRPAAPPPRASSASPSKGTKGAVVEVNSETDFVAKNEQFQDFVRNVAQARAEHRRRRRGAGARGLSGRRHGRRGADRQHRHDRREPVAAPRRGARSRRGRGRVSYVHNAGRPGLGKIGVLVALESAAPAETLTALGKQIAMHIAAANPLALDADGLDPR
jgi:elongation factor Ts